MRVRIFSLQNTTLKKNSIGLDRVLFFVFRWILRLRAMPSAQNDI